MTRFICRSSQNGDQVLKDIVTYVKYIDVKNIKDNFINEM